MRKMRKKMALLLPLALCGTALTGCLDSEELVQVLEDSLVQVLGGEAAGEGASGDGDLFGENAGSEHTGGGATEYKPAGVSIAADGNLGELIVDALENDAFDIRYDFEGSGTVNGMAVTVEGDYEREQLGPTGDMRDSWSLWANLGDNYATTLCDSFYVDGVYYSKHLDEAYICEEPTIEPARFPGLTLFAAAAEGEKSTGERDLFGQKEETEVYTFTQSGDELKAVMEEMCPDLLRNMEADADWSQVSGEWNVSIAQYGLVDNIRLTSPDVGRLIMEGASQGGTGDCSDFFLDLYVSYGYLDHVYTPDVLETAVEGEAIPFETLGDLIVREAAERQAAEESRAIEESIAASFETVEVEGEGTVTMVCGSKTVDFSLPTEIVNYTEMELFEPESVRLLHDVFSDFTGVTRVSMIMGTPEEWIRIYGGGQDALDGAQPATIGGYEGLKYTSGTEGENFLGKKTMSMDYVFATDLGDGVALGFHVSGTYTDEPQDMNEGILEVLMSHCSIH